MDDFPILQLQVIHRYGWFRHGWFRHMYMFSIRYRHRCRYLMHINIRSEMQVQVLLSLYLVQG